MTARLHHYLFAHRETRLAFFREPTRLLERLRGPGGLEMVQHVWSAMGADLAGQGQDALPAEGLGVTPIELAGRPAVVITLPPATNVSEALFVALVAPTADDGARYLTLEHSVSFAPEAADSPDPVMLCEWTADGKHVNYGAVGDRTLERFEAMVEARLA